MDTKVQNALADQFATFSGARSARIVDCSLLSGGAIQQNWQFDLEFDGGVYNGALHAVLRTNSDAVLTTSLTRGQEFALFETAQKAKVRVPEPLFYLDQNNPLGRPLFFMRRVQGTATGRKLVRAFPDGSDRLCHELGVQMARIHSIRPPVETLDFLGAPTSNVVLDWVASLRNDLDDLAAARPVIEMGLRFLVRNAPGPRPVVLCHNDFRTGNYMVDGGALTGILDWEFAGWGDPMQDIGWFTAPCWRFGSNARIAGGIGSLDAFLEGYRAAGLIEPRLEELIFWQILATLRWAVIALAQGERHRSNVQPSLELALTHYIVPELENDILELVAGAPNA